MGVVTARHFAREAGWTCCQRTLLVDQRIFQQALVNAAEMRYRQIAIVDAWLVDLLNAARQRINHRRHRRVGHADARQQRRSRTLEKPAVVGGHPDLIVAERNNFEQTVKPVPVVLGA